MNTPRRLAGALALILATGLLATSCDTGSGLLSSIQQETKASKDSVFLKTAVKDLVYYNNNYYAQLVGIYARPSANAAASGWSLVNGPNGLGSAYGCRGLVATSGGLFAAIYSRSGSSETPLGIFKYDGSSWVALHSGAENIQALYTANDELFAAVLSSGTFNLVHVNSGTGALGATGVVNSPSLPAGVAGDGTKYWAAAGTKLYYHASSPTGLADLGVSNSKSITALVYYSPTTSLFLGTTDGYVYPWNGVATSLSGAVLATSSTSYFVSSLAIVPQNNSGSAYYLIAGNEYQGYYEDVISAGTVTGFTLGSSSNYVTTDSSDYDTSLKSMPIFSFNYVGDNLAGILFASGSATMSTSYPGLWSNTWNGSTWSGWTAE